METTNKYVIFHEDKNEFLHVVKKVKESNVLGWCLHPTSAFKYDSLCDARNTAQRIADNKGYYLTVCELHKSDTKIGLANPIRVSPSSDPGIN